jgi:hypothetical protein
MGYRCVIVTKEKVIKKDCACGIPFINDKNPEQGGKCRFGNPSTSAPA